MNTAVVMNDHPEFFFGFIGQGNFYGFSWTVSLASPAGNAKFWP
jgi:hypothetical protein